MDAALNVKIGNVLKTRRKELKMTQDGVAEMIDVSPGFIGQVERGETSLSLDTLDKLIKTLALDPNAIFSDKKTCSSDDFLTELLLTYQQLNDEDRELILYIARFLLTKHNKIINADDQNSGL